MFGNNMSNFGFQTSLSSNNLVFKQKIQDENDSVLKQLKQKKEQL